MKALNLTKFQELAPHQAISNCHFFFFFVKFVLVWNQGTWLYCNAFLISQGIAEGKPNTTEDVWIKTEISLFYMLYWRSRWWRGSASQTHECVNEKSLSCDPRFWVRNLGSFLLGTALYLLHPHPTPRHLPLDPCKLDLCHQLLCPKVSHPLFGSKELIDHHGPRHIPPRILLFDLRHRTERSTTTHLLWMQRSGLREMKPFAQANW